MTTTRRFLLLATLLLFPSLTSAQQIATIWKNQCAECHANDGRGGDKAKSLLDESLRGQDTDRRFFDAIRDGTINGAVLPAHAFGPTKSTPLHNAKVWGLVNHLRELQARESRKSATSKPDAQGIIATKYLGYRVETVLDGGKSKTIDTPWSMDFIPSDSRHALAGHFLVTNRPGSITARSLSDANATVHTIEGLPKVRNNGQGGLMDIALHPNFNDNGWIYLSFADEELKNEGDKKTSLGMTKVVRGKIIKDSKKNDTLRWTDQETIFEAKRDHYLSPGVHFGSKFAFDPADPTILYFGIGERGAQDMAQDLTRPNGKVHRVKDDGSIPKDNPFVGTKDAYESIWSYGHRNPQGLCFDLSGNLWDTEHAPRGGDELNLVKKGLNYGWPLVSYGINYSGQAFRTPWVETTSDFPKDGPEIEMPKDRWLPSIAACGMCVVNAPNPTDPFHAWHGDLLCGGLAGQNIDRVRIKDGVVIEREEVLYGMGRVRDVVMGPMPNLTNGTGGLGNANTTAIYVVLNGPDRVIRLVPSDTSR